MSTPMLEIRWLNTVETEETLLTITMPRSERKARISVPTIGVLSLPWMVPNTCGQTRSRAIDRVIRADGSRADWVVATVDDTTAPSITSPAQCPAACWAKYSRMVDWWALQALSGRSIWAAMMFIAKTTS